MNSSMVAPSLRLLKRAATGTLVPLEYPSSTDLDGVVLDGGARAPVVHGHHLRCSFAMGVFYMSEIWPDGVVLVLENAFGAEESHVGVQQATQDGPTINTLLASLPTHQSKAHLRDLVATPPAYTRPDPNGDNF